MDVMDVGMVFSSISSSTKQKHYQEKLKWLNVHVNIWMCLPGLTGRCPALRQTTSWMRLKPSSVSCEVSRRPSAQARRRGRTSSRYLSTKLGVLLWIFYNTLCWPLVSVNPRLLCCCSSRLCWSTFPDIWITDHVSHFVCKAEKYNEVINNE